MDDYAALRQRMVDNQIRPSEVTEAELIRAFLSVPRERFMGPEEQAFAYSDREIPISGPGRSERLMLGPVQLARLVQALNLTPRSVVLDVACGTGYSAALLSHLAASVVAVEEELQLAALAQENLRTLGAGNVTVVTGRLTEGYPQGAPYDAILVNGAIEVMPERLTAQLKMGGSLAVIERRERISRAMLYERTSTDVTNWPLFEAWTTLLLPGFEGKPAFVF